MIQYTQNTKSSESSTFSLLNIALSHNWMSLAFSNRNGRDYRFVFNDHSISLKDVIEKASSDYPSIKVRIGLVDEAHTLVPNDFYSRDDEASLLNYTAPSTGDSIVTTDTIYSQGIKNIYYVHTDVFAELDSMENISVHHYWSPFLTFLPRKGQQVFLIWLYDRMMIMGTSNDKVLYCKTHSCMESHEALYYALLCYKACGFDRRQTPLHMMGRFQKESEFYQVFYKYFRNIDLPHVPHVEMGQAHLFYDMYLVSKYM